MGSRSSINKEGFLADQVLGKRDGLDDSWLRDIFLNDALEPTFFSQNVVPNYLKEAEELAGRNVQFIIKKRAQKTETKEKVILWHQITFWGLYLPFCHGNCWKIGLIKSANFEMSHEKETKLVRNEKKIQIKILVFNKSLYKQQMFIRDKCSLKCGLYDIFFEFYYI